MNDIRQNGSPRGGANWWRGCTIYQIYPRSFQDTTGDGIGDLPGICRRLEHAASLGVDAVWLSPFFKSPMEDMGYDVSDYCDVDPLFGTLKDFDSVVREAHRLGLKVIIDQVLSHTSDQHPWFEQSRSSRDNPKADWYVWADSKPDGTMPNNWLSVFGGPAWEWDSRRRQYYLHNFLASQPDLNFHNPEVVEAVLASVRFWLERGVDGFRLDTANFYFHDKELRDNPPLPAMAVGDEPNVNPYRMQDHVYDKSRPENIGFLKRLRALLDQYENRMTVGEISDAPRSLKTVASYTQGNDKLNMCYTFDLLRAPFSAGHIRGHMESVEEHLGDGWICWALSNHDVMRHATRWAAPHRDPDEVARFAIMLLCCLRGSICLYQGEELGFEEADIAFEDLRDPYGIRFWPGFKGRDGCRTPMVWDHMEPNGGFSSARPWLPIPDQHMARSVRRQAADPNSVLNFYRRTLAMRQQSTALTQGGLRLLDSHPDLLAFTRHAEGTTVFCAFNFAEEELSIDAPPGMDDAIQGEIEGRGRLVGGKIKVPPLAWFVAASLVRQFQTSD
jgi:alpha-glucosidase